MNPIKSLLLIFNFLNYSVAAEIFWSNIKEIGSKSKFARNVNFIQSVIIFMPILNINFPKIRNFIKLKTL